MPKATDVRVRSAALYFLPVRTRMPLKFGSEITTSVTCARVKLTVENSQGERACGWGETPLSVQWVWPGTEPYEARHQALKDFCIRLTKAWAEFPEVGHPIEVGHAFLEQALPGMTRNESLPQLAALVSCSPFDLALHDAYGQLLKRPTYSTYSSEFMSRDLAHFLGKPAKGFPADFLIRTPAKRLRTWHLVGGVDPLDESELTGTEPQDGFPVLLRDWITRDGLKCLKIKLRGNDPAWDYSRVVRVGRIALETGVEWLTADFNCTVTDPAYVNDLLDRLRDAEPRLYGMLLYVEQPFPYDLEKHRIDVHSVSARKPLFLDESAHDWRLVRLGRELGWTGVALKTCKTQTGALLAACWAKAHGMTLMVQDLTNPMLAQIPHVLLAAYSGTIMGVETNAMQFYPEVSAPEAAVHPGLYRRCDGTVDLSTIQGPGFGYRLPEISRELPNAAAEF